MSEVGQAGWTPLFGFVYSFFINVNAFGIVRLGEIFMFGGFLCICYSLFMELLRIDFAIGGCSESGVESLFVVNNEDII